MAKANLQQRLTNIIIGADMSGSLGDDSAVITYTRDKDGKPVYVSHRLVDKPKLPPINENTYWIRKDGEELVLINELSADGKTCRVILIDEMPLSVCHNVDYLKRHYQPLWIQEHDRCLTASGFVGYLHRIEFDKGQGYTVCTKYPNGRTGVLEERWYCLKNLI